MATYTDAAPIVLTPTDSFSGCGTTYYKVNNGAWQQGTSFTVVWSQFRRYHNIYWYTVDAVGNVESTKSAVIEIRLNSIVTESSDPKIVYRDDWYSINGGDARAQDTTGSFALISFQGTRLDLFSRKGPDKGKMRVSLVDSATVTGVVDLYDNVQRDGNNIPAVWNTGDLDFGDYIVKVECLGTKHALSSDFEINVDEVKTEGSLTQVPDARRP